MEEKYKSPNIHIQDCLKSLGLSSLADWDVLVFLYRHQASLASAEQIAHLVGYSINAVGDSLDRLESQGLVERSRPSRGVRFYQFVVTEAHRAPEGCFRQLISLAENRTGRLLLVKHIRQNAGLQIAARGKTS